MSKPGIEFSQSRLAEAPRETVSPELLLERLEERIAVARDEKERRDFSGLADELRNELSKRKEATVDATTDVVAGLKARISPEQKARLREVENGVGTAFEKTKAGAAAIREKAGDAAAQAAEKISGSEVARAIRSGDAQKAVTQMAQKAEFASKAAVMVSNVEQMANEIEEQLPFFGAIIAAIMRFFANLAKGFLPKVDKEKLDAAKRASEGAVKDGKRLLETAAEGVAEFENPEKRREYVEKMTGSLAKEFSNRYFAGADLSPEKLGRLRAIVEDSFSTDGIAKIAKDFSAGGESSVWEIFSALREAGNLPSFLFSLAMSGILPVGKIVYGASVETGKAVFSLTLDGIGLSPVFMSSDELSAFFEKNSKSRAFKDYALDMTRIELYRPMGIFYALLGDATASLAKAGVGIFADTATGANGFTVAKGLGIGNFDGVLREFQKIERAVGGASDSWKFSAVFGELKKELALVNRNWTFLAAAKDVGYDVEKIASHPKVLQALANGTVSADDLAKLKAAKGLPNPLQQIIHAPGNRGFVAAQELKMGLGTSEGVMHRLLREIDDVKAFQNTLARTDGGGWEKLNRVGEWMKTLKIVRHADTAVLHLDGPDDVAKLRALQSAWPEGLAGFFKTLPVLGFTASVFSIVVGNRAEGEVGSKEVVNALSMALVPFYGAVNILSGIKIDWSEVRQGKFPPMTDAALGTLAVTTLAIEGGRMVSYGLDAAKLASQGRILDAGRTALKAPFMTAIDIAKSTAYVSRGFHHVRAAAAPTANALTRLLASSAEKAAHARGRIAFIAAGALAAGGVAAAMLDKKTPEEIEGQLKKDGWLDVIGNPSEKFFQTFPSLEPAKQKTILDNLFAGKIEFHGKLPDVSFDAGLREYWVVVDKAEERPAWQKILDRDPQFRDQLAKLGIDVRVVARQEIEELRKSLEKRNP